MVVIPQWCRLTCTIMLLQTGTKSLGALISSSNRSSVRSEASSVLTTYQFPRMRALFHARVSLLLLLR